MLVAQRRKRRGPDYLTIHRFRCLRWRGMCCASVSRASVFSVSFFVFLAAFFRTADTATNTAESAVPPGPSAVKRLGRGLRRVQRSSAVGLHGPNTIDADVGGVVRAPA